MMIQLAVIDFEFYDVDKREKKSVLLVANIRYVAIGDDFGMMFFI